MNAGQRMSRIACGAALENMLCTAAFNGWNADRICYLPAGCGVTFTVNRASVGSGNIPNQVFQRATHRVRYDGTKIPSSVLKRLQLKTDTELHSTTAWVSEPDVLKQIASCVAACDAILFGEPRFFRAFINNIRWDLPDGEIATEGLAVGTLGLSGIERTILPLLGRAPGWLLRTVICKSAFSYKAYSNLRSSSGVAVLLRDNDSVESDYAIGRLVQRVWLLPHGRGFFRPTDDVAAGPPRFDQAQQFN